MLKLKNKSISYQTMSLIHYLFSSVEKSIIIKFTFSETPEGKFIYNKKLTKNYYTITNSYAKKYNEEVLEEYECIIEKKEKIYDIMIYIYSKYNVFMFLEPIGKNKHVFLPPSMYKPLNKIPSLKYLAYKELIRSKYLNI